MSIQKSTLGGAASHGGAWMHQSEWRTSNFEYKVQVLQEPAKRFTVTICAVEEDETFLSSTCSLSCNPVSAGIDRSPPDRDALPLTSRVSEDTCDFTKARNAAALLCSGSCSNGIRAHISARGVQGSCPQRCLPPPQSLRQSCFGPLLATLKWVWRGGVEGVKVGCDLRKCPVRLSGGTNNLPPGEGVGVAGNTSDASAMWQLRTRTGPWPKQVAGSLLASGEKVWCVRAVRDQVVGNHRPSDESENVMPTERIGEILSRRNLRDLQRCAKLDTWEAPGDSAWLNFLPWSPVGLRHSPLSGISR